jgi:8-oxo-dGTP pyrophosphatase MutT (NUDIX family)
MASNHGRSSYLFNYDDVTKHLSTAKHFVYGTVIFQPEHAVIDFGPSAWPAKYSKKVSCPLVLLVQGWTDAMFGLVGGKVEKKESVVDAMNREFLEETGSAINFDFEHDYKFSTYNPADDGSIARLTHLFVKIIHDRHVFQDILVNFHVNSGREAYLDEVFTLVGLPLFIEGPEDILAVNWQNNIWGLPRYLTSHHGGFLTPTLQSSYVVREHFVVMLLCSKLISIDLMRRVFYLCLGIQESPHLLPTFDDFIANSPGLAEVLAKHAS